MELIKITLFLEIISMIVCLLLNGLALIIKEKFYAKIYLIMFLVTLFCVLLSYFVIMPLGNLLSIK